MFDISSPCINKCCLDEQDICLGCFRHIDEIIQWGSINNEQKQRILQNIQDRKDKQT